MAHINDLPAAVLSQILFKATALAETLSEWKANLPLVAVCRAWTKLVQPFVFYHVYVEVAPSPSSDMFPFADPDTRSSWASNAELIISRGCILMARRLAISLAIILTPDCMRSIALDILELDRVDWQHINALTVHGSHRMYRNSRDTTNFDRASEADIARTVQYFGRNMRNVIELDMSSISINRQCDYFCACLGATYGGQLQIHRASRSIPFRVLNIPRNIKVLELSLGLLTSSVLTGICSETLSVLKLYNTPHNFAWHHFRYDTFVQPIVFRKLTVLHLFYQPKDEGMALYYPSEDEDKVLTADEIQEKIALGALNCDQLCFPALRELTIVDCTPDCDLLYADIPFPELKTLFLSGSIDSIRHCTRLKLTWVQHLSVNISSDSLGNSTDIYHATNHYFSNVCIGRTASLSVFVEWFILDPAQIRWVNLTKLI
ncbi:hypothetical protein FBU31_001263, partial [Coemansia sp. 'formosensis']